MSSTNPFVRIVIVSYKAAELTLACLESLSRLVWPNECLEVVLIDNASRDDTKSRVVSSFPWVHVITAETNLGFAGGCNAGLVARFDDEGRTLNTYDFAALINNDAVVEPTWLVEMVRVANRDPMVGVVAPKVLLAPKFSEVVVEPTTDESASIPFVSIAEIFINGRLQDDRLKFDEAFVHSAGHGDQGRNDHWLAMRGAIRIAMLPEYSEKSPEVSFVVRAFGDRTVRIHSGPNESCLQFVASASHPSVATTERVSMKLDTEAFDVINSVGCELHSNGAGGDRGYLERDLGQFDESVEVFAWSGASALIRRAFLDEVGLFDSRFFLYYEDFDLSWRGRLAGWTYVSAPRAVVRHHLAKSTIEGSDLFRFHTSRNRLLTLAKNAPLGMAMRAGAGEVARLLGSIRFQMFATLSPTKVGNGDDLRFRWRVVRSYVRHLPGVLKDRWTMPRTLARRRLLAWRRFEGRGADFTERDVRSLS